jgi:regulator of protease activity HflC (stomatin/prohibitin superfamily)
MEITSVVFIAIAILFVLFILAGIRIIRPTQRGAIETLGKYTGFVEPGFNWIVPIFQHMKTVNITEKMAKIEPQEVITKDNLNAKVDLVVYYKVCPTEADIKKSLYAVNNYEYQIITLARTTARNVIGGMVFKDVNSKRKELNSKLAEVLEKETLDWGVEVVRVELMEILPPNDVQETMNKVIKAENEKDAAIDFATARETEADGIKRANIKEAEGIAQGRLIVADAKAKAIKLVNESARKYFKGNAQNLKQLEVAEVALKDNSKIVLGNDSKSVLKLFDIGKQ